MKRFIGPEELDALKEVIESQELCRIEKDGSVSKFEDKVIRYFGRQYAYALSYEIPRTSAIEYKAGSFPASHFAARSAPRTKVSLLLAV